MATRNIENVPEALAKRLKGQAALHWAKPEPRGHRCLETVAQDAPLDPDSLLARIRVVRRKPSRFRLTHHN